MRGVPPISATKELTKYKMYVTEISLKDRKSPQIISDKPNHYQIWTNYTQRKLEPLEDGTPIASLPEPSLNLGDCSKKDILLNSDDPTHSYHLVFDDSKSKSNVGSGHGSLFHRCKTFLVMSDKNGKLIDKIGIGNVESEETID